MSELLSSIFQARDKVLMLLILTVAVFFVTWLIYVISGRTGPIKYLPGLLLTAAGIYYLYRSMQSITTPEGLNEMISALIFTVIGLIGICFSLILGIYDAGAGRKTKRRVHALDFLQEARSAEPVYMPNRGLPESRPETKTDDKTSAQPAPTVAPSPAAKKSTPVRPADEPKPSAPVPAGTRSQRYAALAAHSNEIRRNALQQSRWLYTDEKENARLAKLENQLEHKHKIRGLVLAYNEKAEQKEQQETVTFWEQIELFFARAGIAVRRKLGEIGLYFKDSSRNMGVGFRFLRRQWRARLVRLWSYLADFIRSFSSPPTQS